VSSVKCKRLCVFTQYKLKCTISISPNISHFSSKHEELHFGHYFVKKNTKKHISGQKISAKMHFHIYTCSSLKGNLLRLASLWQFVHLSGLAARFRIELYVCLWYHKNKQERLSCRPQMNETRSGRNKNLPDQSYDVETSVLSHFCPQTLLQSQKFTQNSRLCKEGESVLSQQMQ